MPIMQGNGNKPGGLLYRIYTLSPPSPPPPPSPHFGFPSGQGIRS